jgi:hypothetical protein
MDAEAWIRTLVVPVGPIAVESEEPWATVWRVPLADGSAFFKACQHVQAFEPRLTAALASRWPDRIPEVLGWDGEFGWLLLRDAGSPLMAFGDQLDAWCAILPLYAELQRGETVHVTEHLAGGVPDRRAAGLPERYAELLLDELPLTEHDAGRMRSFAPRFAELCAGLAAAGISDTIQHDDLHAANVWARDGRARILDWGDACISHPFCTLADTFRLLEHHLALDASDPAVGRLRDSYLEPWGNGGLQQIFADALVVGTFARALGALPYLAVMPKGRRGHFAQWLASLLRRGLALTGG